MISIHQCDKMDEALFHQFVLLVANVERRVQPISNWTREVIEELLQQDRNHLIVASSDEQGKPIEGYCLYQTLFETAEILRMGTHPKWQRRGVAYRLLEELMTNLKQADTENVLLEVRVDNYPAIKLYKKIGFHAIDLRKGYYPCYENPNKRVDAAIMQLHLADDAKDKGAD